MSTKVTIAAIALCSTLSFSNQAHSQSQFVETALNQLVQQAISATSAELKANVQSAVLTAAHVFELDEAAELSKTKVLITDVKVTKTEKVEGE